MSYDLFSLLALKNSRDYRKEKALEFSKNLKERPILQLVSGTPKSIDV